MYGHRNPWGMHRHHMRRRFWGRPWGWHRWGWRPRRYYRGCGCLPFLLIPLMIVAATAFFGFLSWFMW